ncbi:MAG TPA: PadR family transcriptional regulator [Steroidobacteraceae bacterium]|jgi:DNA-binding PadR family transcriptional regulator|nr:PadR family transcriptional regulator [Steroidobacteraceae bacterium]
MYYHPRAPRDRLHAGGRFHGHDHHGGGRRFGGPPHGGGGGRFRRRLLVAADLQLIILALLEEKPRHGYEIIKAVEDRSAGYYSPSAGIVYPALTYLAELGHASAEIDGAKKLYTLTDSGRTQVAENRARIAAIFDELAAIGRRFAAVDAAPRVPEGEPRAFAEDPLAGIFRDLKAALFDAGHANDAERARVIAILQRAIAEIRAS